GLEFLRALKDDPALSAIPVIIVSGDSAAAETALALGAQGFLRKPVDLQDLVTSIDRILR
ncbi:MAG TPA: response regulator, partial [Gemmatimonadales bacterium]|nr:response regulator [Gemmatimonadales bacterium]